ncbi:protein ROOT PRIMORDIUM DEFECTIVE 1 isoform X2 [Morus notabilis]|uniref:protein ROOT PRIMORDIUM DEFECTIVE 1 isoform X2 n=1 Tax=Morus notabilis TaxID=981085 RepID=UPI000CED2DB1|nr:protein ROOT PRIMORDIUM DEFECTIVE 1 isoform X2 [Morus notabilis]
MIIFLAKATNFFKSKRGIFTPPLKFVLYGLVSIRPMSKSTSIPKKLQRVRDHGFDNYMEIEKKTRKILKFQSLILSQRNETIPVSRLDFLARPLGFKQDEAGAFMLKFPHVFEIYEHPVQRILYCRLARKAHLQIERERQALYAQIPGAVTRLRKLLMMSNNGRLRLEHVRIARREFGLPDDFEHSRVPYWSPYEDVSGYDLRSIEAQKRMEKRAVATIHELLNLTVEKKITLERIAHFRMAMNLPKKLKDFLLQHQGVFYISTRGNYGKMHTVFLREAYRRGELVEPNDLYFARRKLAELVLLSSRTAKVDKELVNFERERENDEMRCRRRDCVDDDGCQDFGGEKKNSA